jgi:hypothetical protein
MRKTKKIASHPEIRQRSREKAVVIADAATIIGGRR